MDNIIVLENDPHPWFITNSQEFCNILKVLDQCPWSDTFSPNVLTSPNIDFVVNQAIDIFKMNNNIEIVYIDNTTLTMDYIDELMNTYKERSGQQAIHYRDWQEKNGIL